MLCPISSHVIRRAILVTAAVTLFVASPVRGGTIVVPVTGDLQAALDRAQPGDVILLQAGATYTGNFTLPFKSGAQFITVRSGVADSQLPGNRARMTPALAGRLARIQAPNQDPALRTAAGTHHWRLLALEVAGAGGAGDIIRLGDGSAEQQTLDDVPHDLVVDRCYVHGTPDGGQKRGIALNSASTAVVNSWIADIKAVDQDSQAIAGWNGPGPFTIENNYLEAAGENFLLGGADPSIDQLVPSGVTFRDNWVRKPEGWRGTAWQVKNLLELKNARGVVIEDNVFENNWQAAQAGYAILLTPRNQDGQAPWATVQDVVFRSNVVRHVGGGINILGRDSPHASQQARNITIAGNLLYDVGGQNWGGSGNFLQIGDGPAGLVVEHNTVLQAGNVITVYGGDRDAPTSVIGFVFRDNLVVHNEYGIKGDNYGVGNATLAAYFPGGVVSNNVIAGGSPSAYPRDNSFPSVSQFYAQFAGPTAEDYRLAASSAYLTAASDGLAVGADERAIHDVLAWTLSTGEAGRPRPASPAVGIAKPRIGG